MKCLRQASLLWKDNGSDTAFTRDENLAISDLLGLIAVALAQL
jgi:hypothetical protein